MAQKYASLKSASNHCRDSESSYFVAINKMFAQDKLSQYGWLMQTAYHLEIIFAEH